MVHRIHVQATHFREFPGPMYPNEDLPDHLNPGMKHRETTLKLMKRTVKEQSKAKGPARTRPNPPQNSTSKCFQAVRWPGHGLRGMPKRRWGKDKPREKKWWSYILKCYILHFTWLYPLDWRIPHQLARANSNPNAKTVKQYGRRLLCIACTWKKCAGRPTRMHAYTHKQKKT